MHLYARYSGFGAGKLSAFSLLPEGLKTLHTWKDTLKACPLPVWDAISAKLALGWTKGGGSLRHVHVVELCGAVGTTLYAVVNLPLNPRSDIWRGP